MDRWTSPDIERISADVAAIRNWVRDRANSVPLPQTEFGLARKIAYQKSQEGARSCQKPSICTCFSEAPSTTPWPQSSGAGAI